MYRKKSGKKSNEEDKLDGPDADPTTLISGNDPAEDGKKKKKKKGKGKKKKVSKSEKALVSHTRMFRCTVVLTFSKTLSSSYVFQYSYFIFSIDLFM